MENSANNILFSTLKFSKKKNLEKLFVSKHASLANMISAKFKL